MNLQWIRFLSASEALSSRLAFVDTTTNHAIMKVDNTSTVVYNDKRNSVRLQTNVRYSVGSVWIADMIHVPYGVSSNSFCLLYSAADGSTRSARCGPRGGRRRRSGRQAARLVRAPVPSSRGAPRLTRSRHDGGRERRRSCAHGPAHRACTSRVPRQNSGAC